MQSSSQSASVVRVQNQAEVSMNALLPSCSKRTITSPTDLTGWYVAACALGSLLNSTSKLVTPVVVNRRKPTKPHRSSPTISLWK